MTQIIVFMILRNPNGLKKMHNRFLLPMSFFDILSSIASALTTIPVPKDVLNGCVQGAIGNQATCTAQGKNMIGFCFRARVLDCTKNVLLDFSSLCLLYLLVFTFAVGFFYHLGFIVPSYNAVLCIYYLMIIRWNAKDEEMERLEPYLHAFAIAPTSIVGIVALCLKEFKLYGVFCWMRLISSKGILHKAFS